MYSGPDSLNKSEIVGLERGQDVRCRHSELQGIHMAEERHDVDRHAFHSYSNGKCVTARRRQPLPAEMNHLRQ